MNRTVFIAMPGNPSTPSRRAMRPSDASRQQGTALVMALVILLVMTIFGLSIMNTTSLESKMATNAQETVPFIWRNRRWSVITATDRIWPIFRFQECLPAETSPTIYPQSSR